MSEIAEAIREGKDRKVLDGLYLKVLSSEVINIDAHPEAFDRELTRADVDAVRAAITEAGYVEVEAWLPVQGLNWLSTGVSAGVSFRIKLQEATE